MVVAEAFVALVAKIKALILALGEPVHDRLARWLAK